jgi:hypothetical protein
LHIKLVLKKNFVKGMHKTGHGFEYVKNKFLNMSDTTIKEGIFTVPQIRELMQDNKTESKAWLPFKSIFQDFLGNHKAANYVSGCCTGTVDFVQSYGVQYESENPLSGVTLGFFPGTLGEDGERFHQHTMDMEKRYQGKCTSSMLIDYCWALNRDVPVVKYRRKSCLYILEERFCQFHEHVKYYFEQIESSVSLKPCLIEKFCIHIIIQHNNLC